MNTYLKLMLLVPILLCTNMYGQERKGIVTSLYGGLYINNEQAWQLEPSFAWHFHEYFGVGLGIELTGQYNQPSRQTIIDGYEAELTDNERNIAWIILKPSIIFKTPKVWKSSDNYYRLWFQAEPGISLACPFRNSLTYEIKEFQGAVSQTVGYRKFKNKGLKWFYWNARASVNFAIDRFIIGAGYYISNLDYCSGRRNVTLANGQKFYVPKKERNKPKCIPVVWLFILNISNPIDSNGNIITALSYKQSSPRQRCRGLLINKCQC